MSFSIDTSYSEGFNVVAVDLESRVIVMGIEWQDDKELETRVFVNGVFFERYIVPNTINRKKHLTKILNKH